MSLSVKKAILATVGCCYSAFSFAVCNVDVDMAGNSITGIGSAALSTEQKNPSANDLVTKAWVEASTNSGYRTFHDEYGTWVNIPAYTLPGSDSRNPVYVDGFSVMKYEAKNGGYKIGLDVTAMRIPYELDLKGGYTLESTDTIRIYDGQVPVSDASGRALVTDDEDSFAACSYIGAKVLSAPQYYSLAHQILNNKENWYTGTGTQKSSGVGVGSLPSGRNSSTTVEYGVAASADDTNVYFNTSVSGQTDPAWNTAQGGGGEQIRVFYLDGTNHVVWDLAGNVWERTGSTAGDYAGTPFETIADKAYVSVVDLKSLNSFKDVMPYAIPFLDTDNNNKYSGADQLISVEANAGVAIPDYNDHLYILFGGATSNLNGLFTVNFNETWDAEESNPSVGFRCVK